MRMNRHFASEFARGRAAPPPERAGDTMSRQEHPSEPAAIAVIAVFWALQFVYFSLDTFFRGQPVVWQIVATRGIVSAFGALISVGILNVLQRSAGLSFVKRAVIALALAGGGAAIASIFNWAVFLGVVGPVDGEPFSWAREWEAFPSLFYLFSWVFLAITVILLSITYGGELLLRERRIAELSEEAERGREAEDDPHIWVRKGQGRIRLELSEVDWISAEGECVRFHCGARSFLERLSIRAAAEQFGAFGFVRIHRSTIVNSAQIERLTRTEWGAYEIRLKDGERLRVSKTYQSRIRKLLKADEGVIPAEA